MEPEERRGRVDRKQVGGLTMASGALFALGALLSEAVDWPWVLLLGLALLIYVTPKLHAFQAPADGASGEWGARLVPLGAGLVVALGVASVGWDAVGTAPNDNPVTNLLWIVGIFASLIGMITFAVGSARARVFPQAAPVLMLVALVGALVLDMATGAFFEEEGGTTTPWGFIIGGLLFGLALAWMGYSLWREEPTAAPPATEPG